MKCRFDLFLAAPLENDILIQATTQLKKESEL